MGTPGVGVDPVRVDKAGNMAVDAGQTIAGNLMRVLNDIENNQVDFAGDAGNAFRSMSGQIGEQLRNLLSALNDMAQEVHASNARFGATDQEASRQIKSVADQYLPGASEVRDSLRG